jgi:hypothetical protein
MEGLDLYTRFSIATIAICCLAGCASANLGDKSTEAELKRFASRAGATSLYVCREDAFNGGGIGSEVFVNGASLGSLKPNTFAQADIAPGEISVFLRRTGFGHHSGDSGTLKVVGKPGEVVIVWAGPAGFMGPLTVDFFPSVAEAQACVQKASYAVR